MANFNHLNYTTRERFVDGEAAGHEKSMRFVPFSIFEKSGALTGGQSAGAGLSEPVGHVTCHVTR